MARDPQLSESPRPPVNDGPASNPGHTWDTPPLSGAAAPNPGHTWDTPSLGHVPNPGDIDVQLLCYVEVDVADPAGPDNLQSAKLGFILEIRGFGFEPNSKVEVQILDFPSPEMDGSWTGITWNVGQANADASGRFSTSYQPPINYFPDYQRPDTFNGTPRVAVRELLEGRTAETPIPGGINSFFRPLQ